ncbi:MAG TPA: VWA domain-containing protein [Myxococcota bacterium]|nr:VWA domain-containing protein [Myxococcota bacterium]
MIGASWLGIDGFARPLLFLACAAAVACTWLATLRAPPAAFEWPGLEEARRAGARRRDPVRAAARALRIGALLALAALVAGPEGVHRAPPEPGLGLDLTLVLDASGSMRALDTQSGDTWRSRIDLARDVVARFAGKRAAEGDRVALVVFGDTAFTLCPLSSDGALLARALERVTPGIAGEATALGQALALAVKRASAASDATANAAPGAGRAVVLLTDGRHNAGAPSPEIATELAIASGVRVHAVGIGTAGEEVAVPGPGGALHFERQDVDAAALEAIATATGGRYFAARRPSDLEAVYAEIDRLERAEHPRPSRVRRSERPEPLLAAAGGLLFAEIALARVWRRRLP